MSSAAPDIFDRRRRHARRTARLGVEDFIGRTIGDALIERLGDVTRRFRRALVLGARDETLVGALRDMVAVVEVRAGGDEDQLDVEPGSYDLIVWPGGLESVNDVPGALLRARLALEPDGLLLGALVGDGSFPALRSALARAAPQGAFVARMHPQIDVAAIGNLMQRCGLALPVIDVDRIDLAYRSVGGLIADLRATALTNLLAGPVHPVSRAGRQAMAAAFAAMGDGERTTEQLRIIHFSGWAPHDSQPQPARRGSATHSLGQALKPR